jgi:hypothetical protein
MNRSPHMTTKRTSRGAMLMVGLMLGVPALAEIPSVNPAPQNSSAGTVTGLIAKVRSAYSEISLARKLLGKGNTHKKGAQSLLSQAMDNLDTARSAVPAAGLASQVEKAKSALQANGGSSSSSGTSGQANPVESAYQKVSDAQTLLQSGKTSSARSVLGQVPSLSSVESSLTRQTTGQ